MTIAYDPSLHTTIPADVHADILQRLARAEQEHDVRILFAIESGSRAWGFASPNSDYDVRFIYAHPPQWYQAVDLEERRDVIEYTIIDDIDLNGWDVRKALRLFWKSNPAFVEWMQSPIRYMQSGCFHARALTLLPEVYAIESGIHHYRSMAKTNDRGYLHAAQVPLKKYFYVLRPLLSVLWLERYGTPAPIEFHALLHLINDQPALLDEIGALLERKRHAPEMGLSAPIAPIDIFIGSELDRLETLHPVMIRRATALHGLNALFHAVLAEHNPH